MSPSIFHNLKLRLGAFILWGILFAFALLTFIFACLFGYGHYLARQIRLPKLDSSLATVDQQTLLDRQNEQLLTEIFKGRISWHANHCQQTLRLLLRPYSPDQRQKILTVAADFMRRGAQTASTAPADPWAEHRRDINLDVELRYFLTQFFKANIPWIVKSEYLDALLENGEYYSYIPARAYEAMHKTMQEHPSISQLAPALQRRAMILLTGLHGTPLHEKIIQHYDGVDKILAQVNDDALTSRIIRRSHDLSIFFMSFKNKPLKFVSPWSIDDIEAFHNNLPALTKTKPLLYSTNSLFSFIDTAGLPVTPDLPVQLSANDKNSALRQMLTHWPDLKDGKITIHDLPSLQRLAATWKVFFQLQSETIIDQSIAAIELSGLTLSTEALAASADISRLFQKRIVQAVDPLYQSIQFAPVNSPEDLQMRLPTLTFLQQLNAIDSPKYPKYNAYGRALADQYGRTLRYISHIPADMSQHVLNYTAFLRTAAPARADELLATFIQARMLDIYKIENLMNIARLDRIRREINRASPGTGDIVLINAVGLFIKNAPVTRANINRYLKVARAWHDEAIKEPQSHDLYRLCSYFIAQHVHNYVKHAKLRNKPAVMHELAQLGIIAKDHDQAQEFGTKINKLALNIAWGNWSRIASKAGINAHNVTVAQIPGFDLPQGYSAQQIRGPNGQSGYLFLVDPKKGARARLGFDIGFRSGGVLAKDFHTSSAGQSIVMHFPIGFTTQTGYPTDIAVESGEVKGWFFAADRDFGMLIIYSDGNMKIIDKRILRIRDLYQDPAQMKRTDRSLDFKDINDYHLFMDIAKAEKLSIITNMLLIDDNYVGIVTDGTDTRRLLVAFSDGRYGVLNMDAVSTRDITKIASGILLDNGARVTRAIYCDTGGYNYIALHTQDGQAKLLGLMDHSSASNQLFLLQTTP